MKILICMAVLAALLCGRASGAEVPPELHRALPPGAEAFVEGDLSTTEGFLRGVEALWQEALERGGEILHRRVRGAAQILLAVVLCGFAESFWQGLGEKGKGLLSMAGALTVALLTMGDLESLMGLGRQTVEDLSRFSHVLLPAMAAATAAAGNLGSASVQQVGAVVLVELLMGLIREVLVPLVYLYAAMLTAACALPEDRLGAMAEGMKKGITWLLTTVLIAFTLYLSVARVITGAVDAASVRLAKAAISGVVPVVGGIIAEAAETVLAGAGLLKNTIGIFGTLAVLGACLLPFLQLGIQYLLYKFTAFLAAVLGVPRLSRLIDGLGGAFGLVLGMTGSCAVLVLVAVLSSVAAVTS